MILRASLYHHLLLYLTLMSYNIIVYNRICICVRGREREHVWCAHKSIYYHGYFSYNYMMYFFSKENFAGKPRGCLPTFMDGIPSKPVGVD
jgi:hypothetical protein